MEDDPAEGPSIDVRSSWNLGSLAGVKLTAR